MMAHGPRPTSPLVRFWSKVALGEGCWEWTGATNGRYGTFHPKRTHPMYAHRFAFEVATASQIPNGMYVCHACDNPLCVRPSHLFLGTHADNMADMDRKGRRAKQRKKATHCRGGHLYTPENTRYASDGARKCRLCEAERFRRAQARAVATLSGRLCACGCGRETHIAAATKVRKGIVKGQPLRYLRGHAGRNKSQKAAEDYDKGRVAA